MSFRLPDWTTTPQPKKKVVKKKVKSKKVSPAVDRQITRAVRQVGTTTKKAAPKVSRTVNRTVARTPKPAASQYQSTLDIINQATKKSPVRKELAPGIRTGGITDLTNLVGSRDGRSLGGFIKNYARGAVDTLVSVPATAQLVGEAALAPVVGAYNLTTGGSVTGVGRGSDRSGLGQAAGNRLNSDLSAAVQGVKADYAYRYGPLVRGDVGEFGARFYNDPFPTIADAFGAKAIVGRAPNAVLRATRSIAPESRVGLRASRSLSALSAPERTALAEATGKRILPGAGGRYRPPRKVTSVVARSEDGLPVAGISERMVPQRAYSGDLFARARQKGVDKARTTVVPKIERAAEARVLPNTPPGTRGPGMRRRVVSKAASQVTAQAKHDRAMRRATLDLKDLADARAEVATARSRGTGKSTIAKLKRDKNHTGADLGGLSVEEAAWALHSRDILSDTGKRGGLSNVALRDLYVKNVERAQREARAQGRRTANSRAQLDVIKSIPDELLNLTDTSNPAVRRVIAARDEARRLNANAQLRSIESGIVSPSTVAEAATRDSAITVGGARWGRDVMAKVNRDFHVRARGVRRQIASAREAGNTAEVKRLEGRLSEMRTRRSEKISAIRKDATRDTPELQAAFKDFYEAQAKLDDARGASVSKVSALTRARDKHFKRLRAEEDAALGFTSPRRPELVGNRGVYTPDRPVEVRPGYTGPKPGGRMSGPDQARRSQGRLKATGNIDMRPELMLHQHKRAMQNYTGRISAQALNELLDTARYIDPRTGKALSGNRQAMLAAVESGRARLVNVAGLRKALRELDDLKDGKFLDEQAVGEVFTKTIPEGAKASDYVAISEAAAKVWTEAMTKVPVLDNALNYWKGGLLALSPRWYVNNSFGLALQYGLMAGTDVRSILQASNGAFYKSLSRRLDKMFPNVAKRLATKGERNARVSRSLETRQPNLVRDTLASDLVGENVPRAVAFGFHINNKFEEFWRRSATVNRTKQALRNEGIRPGSLSEAQMARLIEKMPESMARNIISDVEYFIGDYRKFNKFEREVLKRVIPFYSWLRVISRLTFALPFRSPVRAAALTLLETASTAGINPNDRVLDPYERGALRILGKAVPTWGLNPWQTLVPVVEAGGEKNPLSALSKEAIGWINPIAQFFINQAAGTNNFGNGVIAPPWEASFTGQAGGINSVTGRPSRQNVSIPWSEAVLSAAFPGQISVLRRVAAGGRSAYDTTSTPTLVNDWVSRLGGGKRNESLYRPESKRKGRSVTGLNTYSTALGIPVYNQDDAALVREAEKALRKALADQRRLARKKKRATP